MPPLRSSTSKIRHASHAGSWYTDNPKALAHELQSHLSNVKVSSPGSVKAVIGPHAGYSFCAATASHAYRHVDVDRFNRVLVMGPSHRKYIDGIALGVCDRIETPLGTLHVDREEMLRLAKTAHFEQLSPREEEAEHSLEMHFPWIAKLFEKRLDSVSVVPMVVGDIHASNFKEYASCIKRYIDDPKTFVVVSSDFCHWGPRFDYTFYDKSCGAIYKSIEQLDKLGMDAISTLDASQFRAYLKKYHNTICGRHPIMLLLHTIANKQDKYSMKWLDYSQSNQVVNPRDSSVSYASGVLVEV